MRYQVSCPVAIGASSWSISDELGQSPFRVDCRSWNGGDAIGILDGRSVMVAEARLHRGIYHRHCELFRNGQHVAHIRTSLLRGIRSCFVGELYGPDTLEVHGAFEDQQYRFVRCNRTVALVSSMWGQTPDSFGVELCPSEDAILILIAALAIRGLCGPVPQPQQVFTLPQRMDAQTAGSKLVAG